MTFYPEPKPVPDNLRTDDLYLEMLAPKHVDIDYEAFMSSRPRLRLWSGGGWPNDDFTREDNMQDMAMHRDEFVNREAFAYTVLNPDATRCEGCIYIRSAGERREKADGDPFPGIPDDAAIVSYWVREDALERDLDRQLLSGLLEWFDAAWEFPNVLFIANEHLTRDIACYGEVGLKRLYSVPDPDLPQELYFYG